MRLPQLTDASANVAQNDAFVAAFFRAGVSGTLTGYDFTYDAGANGHMEQNSVRRRTLGKRSLAGVPGGD